MSGGAGGNTGKSDASQSDPTADTLSFMSQGLFLESLPTRIALFDTMNKILAGEDMSNIPMIAGMQEQNRFAGSQSMDQVRDQMAQSGLAGTPFGEEIMASTQFQSDMGVQQVANQFASQMMGAAPGFAGDITNASISGMTGATGGNISGSGSSSGTGGSGGMTK